VELGEAEFAAEPGLGERQDNERDGIPMRAKATVPGCCGAENTEGETDEASYEGVLHGLVWGEASGEIATDNAEDEAIESGQQEWTTGRVLAQRRKHTEGMKDDVGGNRKNDDKHKAGEQSENATADAARRDSWRDGCGAHGLTPAGGRERSKAARRS